MVIRRKEIAGQKIGRLLVKEYAGKGKHKSAYWLCVCDCGNEIRVRGSNLITGETKSCGCLMKDRMKTQNLTHGHTRNGTYTSEYSTWRSMLRRCNDEKFPDYYLYGGRGIKVCDRWKESFQNFIDDMGMKPTLRHSIDRYPDKLGNYEPGNCRWATQRQQHENRTTSKLTFEKAQEIRVSNFSNKELAEKYGVSLRLVRDIKANKKWKE